MKIIIKYFQNIDYEIILKSNSINFKNYFVFKNVKNKKILKILFYFKISNWLKSPKKY